MTISNWTEQTHTPSAPKFSALLGRAEVLGAPFHATAIRVEEQRAVDPYYQDTLDTINRINGDVSAPLNIPGYKGNYVLVLYPFSV